MHLVFCQIVITDFGCLDRGDVICIGTMYHAVKQIVKSGQIRQSIVILWDAIVQNAIFIKLFFQKESLNAK